MKIGIFINIQVVLGRFGEHACVARDLPAIGVGRVRGEIGAILNEELHVPGQVIHAHPIDEAMRVGTPTKGIDKEETDNKHCAGYDNKLAHCGTPDELWMCCVCG